MFTLTVLRDHPHILILSSTHQPLFEPSPTQVFVTVLPSIRGAWTFLQIAVGKVSSSASSLTAETCDLHTLLLQIWETGISPYGNREITKVQVKC